MDYLPLILGAFALMMFMQNKKGSKGADIGSIASLLSNPNALSALSAVNKLTDPKLSKDENKTAIIFELLANPFVGELLEKLIPKPKQEAQDIDDTEKSKAHEEPLAKRQAESDSEAEAVKSPEEKELYACVEACPQEPLTYTFTSDALDIGEVIISPSPDEAAIQAHASNNRPEQAEAGSQKNEKTEAADAFPPGEIADLILKALK